MVEIENNNKTPVSQSDESNGVPTIISASVINPDFVTVSNRRAKLKKGLAKLELKEKFENRKSLCVTSGIINALLLIVAIGFIVLWIVQVEKNSQFEICTTRECLLSAFRLINSMDKGFDACDDFYQFVCGNWQLQNPASSNNEHTSLFKETKNSLRQSALDLLTEEIYRKEPLALQLAKKLYKECMKTELIEHLGMHSLKELLVTLGLPKELPNKNESENFDLTGTLSTIQYHLPLTDALLTVGLTVHPKDETKRMILLSMPKKERMYKIQSLVRHDPDYIVGKRKKRSVPIFVTDEVKYRTTVMEIFENEKVHGEKLNETILRAAAFKTVTVETDLSNAMPKRPQCKVVTIADLQKQMDRYARGRNALKINWLQFFQILLKDVKGLTITPNFEFAVDGVEYFTKLANIIVKQKSENIQRFLWWKVVDFFIPYTMRSTRELRYVNDGNYYYKENVHRPLECMKTVEETIPSAVFYKFVNQPEMNTTRMKIEELLTDIKDSLASRVVDAEWLIGNTSIGALEKLDYLNHTIGYPEEYLQEEYLESLFDENSIVRGNLLESLLNLYTSSSKQALSQLLQPVSRQEVILSAVSALDINAYNILTSNSIVILPGLLQPPFYGMGIQAMNYGAVGAIIGHELIHTFDDEGRKYGKYGELSNWWNINSTLAIEKKKKCFLRQYDKYQMYDKYLRPKNSEGENIADNGGIRHAYKAYKNFKDRNGEEPRLPGLEEYSNEQLFFLSFAYMWCSNYTRPLISKMVDEYYIPDKYRVIGSLSNMKEFSDAWNCPAGKFMNREEKCVIW